MSVLQLGTLEKANKILDLYNDNAESFTFSEIVEKTGLEKGSVQRLLFTLQHLGLLRRHQRYKRYSLSPRFISYAVSFLQADPLMAQAMKHLEPLARQTTQNVSITLMDGVHVFYLSRIPNLVSHDFALLPVRRYAYCTAGGRAIMSRLAEDDVERMLAHSPLRKLTNQTIIDVDELRRIIAVAREEGVAWQDGEVLEMELGVAAPVLGDGDVPVAAVTISVDKERYTIEAALEKFGPMVRAAAHDMSNPGLSAGRFPPSWG
ncbi:DNA-binding IclR family transcriptional regulator [Rhodoligotrophos appendicifer]|uniref:IclR family transcriptional regulator n=1 Tax=Rhodoligotrophos appendicifer TaxID=987056 RepID=UPI00117E5A84|nr:IclR family transcriptional regulator [Rhodoligotrophos appendicifer]